MSIKEFVEGREYEITGCSNCHGFEIGSRVVAVAQWNDAAWTCKGDHEGLQTTFVIRPSDVKEIIEPKKEEIVEKVKIGDVLVITGRLAGHEFRMGERVSVLDVESDDPDLPWYVTSDLGEKWWVGPKEVERAVIAQALPLVPAEEVVAATPASDVPKLPAYAVMQDGQVRWISTSREEARGVKAVLGGKAAGAILYKLTVEKEVR